MEEKTVITSYKAFKKDFTCRGFQYEVGKEYTIKGEIYICSNGFHACENPCEVLRFYNATNSRFAIVEQSGDIIKANDSSKICSSRIKIVKELTLDEFISECVKYGKNNQCDYAEKRTLINSTRSNVFAYLDKDFREINDCVLFSNFITDSIGNSITLNARGSSVIATHSINSISISGKYNSVISNGCNDRISLMGYESEIASIGDFSTIMLSGDGNHILSSGDCSNISVIGIDNKIECVGNKAAISYIGNTCYIKAKNGSVITIIYRDCDKFNNTVIVKTVGEEQFKEDTWYRFYDGEFEELTLEEMGCYEEV
jgi:hypothetical protein